MTSALDDADRALRHLDGAAALSGYAAALTAGPDPDGRARAGSVRALWLLRRWTDARQLLAALPDSVHTWLARGVVALGQPDYAAWLAVDRGSALRDDDAALAAFTAALEHEPDNPEAAAGYATALRMSGQPAQAHEYLRQLPRTTLNTAPVRVELAMCAAELDDDETAADHADQALALEPDHVHAHLVRLELARRSRQDVDELVKDAAGLAERYPVPDTQIMLGRVLLKAGRRSGALDAFSRVTQRAPHPSAVHGIVTVVPSAVGLLAKARYEEPESPLLRRAAAQRTTDDDSTPEQRLAAWRTVLDADPRDLGARLATAEALAALDRTGEARAVVDRLRAELPGNTRVVEAWVGLETPWRMPDVSPTRIERPWDTRRDDRKTVLAELVAEVVSNLRLSPEVAGRLEGRLEVDSGHVFRQAADDEQAYLAARDDYLAAVARAHRHTLLVVTGQALVWAGGAVVAIAFGQFWWLLLALADLPALVGIGVPAVLGAVALGYFSFGLRWRVRNATDRAVSDGVHVTALAGLIWQGVVWLGAGWGIAAGFATFVGAMAVELLGLKVQSVFGEPLPRRPQEAFDRWLESLYGRGLLPAAAEASSQDSASSVVLPAHCRIVSETVTALDTPATRELRRLLRQRSRGSFALAGPRGAGKSTLMERWCAGHFLRADSERLPGRRNLAVKVDAPVGYQSQEFLHHLFGQVCEAVERHLGPPSKLAQRTRRFVRGRAHAPVDPAELVAAHLRRRAARERENIRYIRSRTTEGEMSVGVPVVGAKGKVAVQRSDVPLNHPELVGRFRDFLREAAEYVGGHDGKVLIGIDELDRISNGDDAQRFINELKAVFNVPNCYFLVSVSEDALADFELAAMGMRTVFDSAFDTIVRVDYLEFAQARILLNRRVIDLPEQFAALAYVLSGGLARELARLAEEIGDDRSTDDRDLASMTAHLVRRQLSRTTRAAADRLSRSDDRHAGAVLIPVLDEHPRGAVTADELAAYATRVEETGRTDDEPALVAAIRLDVAVMGRFLAMLLRIFDNDLTEERMAIGRTRGLGDFETFARVRRYLGANPYGALELLNACAKVWRT
ncbi:tetratricopeptide repeat protein [Actinophytocola sp. KF-1]